MSTAPFQEPTRAAVDFEAVMHGKMTAEKMTEVTTAMKAAAAAKYPATGSIASLLFYFKIQVQIKGGKTFDGQAGGIGFPGGGALFGDVYTEDLDRLYRDTHSFQWLGTAVYFTVNYFDSNSNFLGTFQAGAVSIAVGTGGGTGRWT